MEQFEQLNTNLLNNLTEPINSNNMEKLQELKKLFDSKGFELLMLKNVDEQQRKQVQKKMTQMADLWQKSVLKPFSEISKPFLDNEKTTNIQSPVYLLNPSKFADLSAEVYDFENEVEQQKENNGSGNGNNKLLPRLDSHSLSDSFNTKNFAESVDEMLAEFQNALAYLDFNQFPIETLDEWDARLKVN